MASSVEEQIGARLTVLGSAAFVRNLQAGTKALQDYAAAADEAAAASARAADGLKASAAAADTATASQKVAADTTATAADKQALVGDAAIASSGGLRTATEDVKAHTAAISESAGVIAKWGSLLATGVVYEGIKNYMAFNQQMQQAAIDAGLKASQIPGLSKGVLSSSSQYGISATEMSQGLYRIASAAPGLHETNAELLNMLKYAAQLTTIFGNTGNMDSVSRMYGAINSTKIGLGEKSKTTMSPLQINEWAKAVAGHGDLYGGDLVAALGTGVLTGAKAYGYSLNDVGAWIDTMSPAMGASKVASLINHGMGMLSGPTAQAGEMMSLMGSNVLAYHTAKSKGGLLGEIDLIHKMMNTPLTGKNFYSKFYGEGMGSETGGTGGTPTGGTALLRAMQFSPAEIAQAIKGGMASVPGMEQAVLVKMFGGAKGATPILNLVNNPGILANKYKQIQAQENPQSYEASLKLAMKEPITQWHIFEQTLKDITITLGKEVTPTFVDFLHGIEGFATFLSHEGWARDALLYGSTAVLGGSIAIKIGSEVSKVAKGLGSLLGIGGSTSLTGAGVTMNTAADKMLAAADRMGLGGAGAEAGAGGAAAGAEEGVLAGTLAELIIPAIVAAIIAKETLNWSKPPPGYVKVPVKIKHTPFTQTVDVNPTTGQDIPFPMFHRVGTDVGRGTKHIWDSIFGGGQTTPAPRDSFPIGRIHGVNTVPGYMAARHPDAFRVGGAGGVNTIPGLSNDSFRVGSVGGVNTLPRPGPSGSSIGTLGSLLSASLHSASDAVTQAAHDSSSVITSGAQALNSAASALTTAASELTGAASSQRSAAQHLMSIEQPNINIGAIAAAMRNQTARG